MNVQDLPEKTNLTKIKVKLPKKALDQYKSYCGGEEEMWIVGSMMGDFFLTPDKPTKEGERKLFPMPELINPGDILKWKVVENLY